MRTLQAEGNTWAKARACLPPKQVLSAAALELPPGSPQGPEEPALPHYCFQFFNFLNFFEGDEVDSCCYPAVMLEHRAQPRCVSPSVLGEVAPGPRAKSQEPRAKEDAVRALSPEGWERRYTEPGSREAHNCPLCQVGLVDTVCSGHGDQDIFSDDQNSCLSQLLLNQMLPPIPFFPILVKGPATYSGFP